MRHDEHVPGKCFWNAPVLYFEIVVDQNMANDHLRKYRGISPPSASQDVSTEVSKIVDEHDVYLPRPFRSAPVPELRRKSSKPGTCLHLAVFVKEPPRIELLGVTVDCFILHNRARGHTDPISDRYDRPVLESKLGQRLMRYLD